MMPRGSHRMRSVALFSIAAGLLGAGCTVDDGFGPTSNGSTGNGGSTATIDQLSGGFALTLSG